MTGALVVAIVDHLHIVDTIGNETAKHFIVDFARELEGAFVHLKVVVDTSDKMDGALAADLLVETCIGDAADGGGVAQLFIERCLIV